ncbi:MAG: hypothetical protein RMJ44_12100 [Cytophagales bacterium]|nr:hypothetical protein [Bernardetiaceae bacterium]MDW8211815.1 hypothetical protein [Cytophagales bacterium]
MMLSGKVKMMGIALVLCVIPFLLFAQRGKSNAKQVARYRLEQQKRKEQAKRSVAQKANKMALKKDESKKNHQLQSKKSEKTSANELKTSPTVQVIELTRQENPQGQPSKKEKEQSPDQVLQTDIVPTIELKTKNSNNPISNLAGIFNQLSGIANKNKKIVDELWSIASFTKQQKKTEKGTFEGIKIRRMIIRHPSGFVEKFHYVKEFQSPPPNIDELYYYNKLTRKITMRNLLETGMQNFDKENFLLLHGPYLKTKGDQVYESGYFYLGAKHGRWEKFDKNFVLQEKLYFNKGLARDAELTYQTDEKGRQRLKEVIPLQHGLRHGTYVAYYPSGRIAVRGQYVEGCRVGRWIEYYDRDKNPRKRETVYPRRPHDDTPPYVSREWDLSGKLIIDHRQR